MKIIAKLILNVVYHGWATENIFQSRLPKTVLTLNVPIPDKVKKLS